MIYNFKLNKQALIITMYSVLFLMSDTTGFDIYAHTTIYYYYSEVITHSYMFFDSLVIPRYILLSTFYDLVSRIGVPIGVFIVILTSLPIYSLLKALGENKRYNLTSIFIILTIFLLMLFYSGLSVVVLYLIAFSVTKKKIFMIGFFFHPVGVIFGLVFILIYYLSFFWSFTKYSFIILLFYYFISHYQLLTASEGQVFKYSIGTNELYEFFLKTIEHKKQEYIVAIISATFIYFGFKKRKNMFSVRFKFANIYFSILLLSVVFYLSSKPNTNLLYSIITADINDVIYLSWFDWGEKDINTSFWSLFNERLKGTGGI